MLIYVVSNLYIYYIDNNSFKTNNSNQKYKEVFTQTDLIDPKFQENKIDKLEKDFEQLKKIKIEVEQQNKILKEQNNVLINEFKAKSSEEERQKIYIKNINETLEKLKDKNFSMTHEIDILKNKLLEYEQLKGEYEKLKSLLNKNRNKLSHK